jgi:hypothetical protein
MVFLWLCCCSAQSVEQKLRGVHPAEVMIKELQSSIVEKIRNMARDKESGLSFIVNGAPGTVRLAHVHMHA